MLQNTFPDIMNYVSHATTDLLLQSMNMAKLIVNQVHNKTYVTNRNKDVTVDAQVPE